MELNWWKNLTVSITSINAWLCPVKRVRTSNLRSKTLSVQESLRSRRNPREHLPTVEVETVPLPKLWDKKWVRLLTKVPRNSIKMTERITKNSEMSKLRLPQLCRPKLKPQKILVRTRILPANHKKLKKLHSVIGAREILAHQIPNLSSLQRNLRASSTTINSTNSISIMRNHSKTEVNSSSITTWTWTKSMLSNHQSLAKIVEAKRRWCWCSRISSRINKTRKNMSSELRQIYHIKPLCEMQTRR